jgi:hypothetical protein
MRAFERKKEDAMGRADNAGAGEARIAIEGLGLDAYVLIASGAMSAEDLDGARDAGRLTLKAPVTGAAYLEVGGIVVAEGRLRAKRGKSAFVVTRSYQESSEVVS